MKKFIFPLQKVLEVRELEEKKSMKEVSDAMTNHLREQQRLSRMQAERNAAMKNLRDQRMESVPASILSLMSKSINGYSERVNEQQQNVMAADDILKQCRYELIEISKKRKIVQKLRETKLSKYKSAVQKEDQKIIDEIAGIRTFLRTNIF